MKFAHPAFRLAVLVGALGLLAGPAQAKPHHRHLSTRHHATATTTPHAALTGNSPKYASLVIDAQTGAVYHQDDPDKLVHPASLTKMMTLAVVFNALSQHRYSLQSRVPVSAFAHSMAPSKLDIPIGSTISVENAIYAVVTHSSNDIAVALGEFTGGSQANFSRMMDGEARALGMTRSNFVNACGLHNPAQVTTARDMATLARALIYRYPQYYHYFATPSFTYDGKLYANHNHLMESYPGMDGIKTGYIVPSGFNLVASARHGNRRLIGVIFGGTSAHGRDVQMAQLLDAAFAQAATGGPPPQTAPAMPAPGLPAAVPTTSQGLIAALAPGQHILAQPALQPANTVQGVAARTAISTAPAEGEGDDDTNDSVPAPLPGRIATIMRRDTVSPPGMQVASAAPAPVAQPVNQNWSVQIGAYGDQVKTGQALQAALAGLPPGLRHAYPTIAPLASTSGTVYRGRLGGLTQAEAMQVCRYIANCLTIGPDADN